jgi:hypothetical protein
MGATSSKPKAGKLRLLTPDALDGRTKASKAFEAIIAAVTQDLGGDSELTEIERHLVVSFAGSAVMQQSLITELLSGQPVDVERFSTNASSLIRGASRLGTSRRARTVVPSVADYVRQVEPVE